MTKFFISRTKISNRCFACDQVAVKCTFENGEEEKRGGKKKKKKKKRKREKEEEHLIRSFAG